MIVRLSGTLVSKTPAEAVIDVQGVGYAVHTTLATYGALPEPGRPVTILTHLVVREDAHLLFGFATEDERTMFRQLLTVNGIGPKLAQNILSGISGAELRPLIRAGNAAALTAIPGIGRKTAERILIELKDRLAEADDATALSLPSATPMESRTETLQALMALGFTRATAEKAIRAALQDSQGTALTVEELTRRSLRYTGK